MTSPYLNAVEAASYVRMNVDALKVHARAGKIKAGKCGREWRFKTEWLDAWVMGGKS